MAHNACQQSPEWLHGSVCIGFTMSNFACENCGRTQVDKDGVGYVAGCEHYPPEHSDFVNVFFGGDEPPVKAFYSGGFYTSVLAKNQGRAIHPVYWESDRNERG